MNRAMTVFLTLFVSLPAIGQTPHRDLPQVEIESISVIPDGFDVSVVVRNQDSAVFLPIAPVKDVVIRFVEIQQWDEKLGWQFVGPCSDVAPMATVELEPFEKIQNNILLTNKSLKGFLCPSKIQHLGGKIRAVLLRAYESDEQFKALDPRGRVHIVSESVEVPSSK